MLAQDLLAKCTELRSKWSVRDQKMREWYNILILDESELKQEGMESVISNDPRTGYNLAKHLIASSIVSDKIPADDLTSQEIDASSYLESFVSKRWIAEEHRYRIRGRQGFKQELVGFMMATGWLSMFSMVEPDKIWTEVWNPIDVYPEFGPDGLVEVAHIYTMPASVANRKMKLMGWTLPTKVVGSITLFDYWGYDDSGDVVNGIMLGDKFVKPLVVDEALSNLIQKLGVGILPVFVTPVGGLPDMGSINLGGQWQEHFGESIVAVNESLTTNYNKMLSYSQQAVRNAAQPRWVEETTGDTPILSEETMNKWGSMFKVSPGEKIYALQPPSIPVELRTMLFDYQNMIQRGAFPWAMYGNIQMQMSYLAMANIASSALQVLTPYLEAFRGIRTDVDNYWVRMMLVNGMKPYGFKTPKNLPADAEFDVQADIEIPGYLIQRATVARMLDPTFRLPSSFVTDKLFPEVKDPLKAQAQVRQEQAMMHPKAIIVDTVLAYREQARLSRDAGDKDAAALYEKAAASMESELGGQPQQPSAAPRQALPPEAQQVVPPREVLPAEASMPEGGI